MALQKVPQVKILRPEIRFAIGVGFVKIPQCSSFLFFPLLSHQETSVVFAEECERERISEIAEEEDNEVDTGVASAGYYRLVSLDSCEANTTEQVEDGNGPVFNYETSSSTRQ